MKPKLLTLTSLCLLFSICLSAQRKQKNRFNKDRVICTFGDVKSEDFEPSVYTIDSSAEAVYLYDGGSAKFQGNTNGFFDVVYTVHERIRLMKKNSFDNLAKVEIPVYKMSSSDGQKLSDVQATTYNIENGTVVATKIDKNSMFHEKDGDYTTIKFTFPSLKEGSIIEYTYTLTNPGHYLPSWSFQGSYPRLYSEYETEVPQFYDYVLIRGGYVPYTIDTVRISSQMYHIVDNNGTGASQTYNLPSNSINNLWAMKDVPALKKENFTTTLSNHMARLEFQLSAIRYPEMPPKFVMHNWTEVSTELMKDEDFGADLARANNYFNDDIKAASEGAASVTEKVKKIYEWVRNNYSCTDYSAKYLSQPIRKTYQTKKGNVADINLMLTAMLLSQNVTAHPVLLSTSDHGKAFELYPILSKFNYVICQAEADGKKYLLDAADNKLGFNHLNLSCYNGYSRVVNPDFPELLNLSPDSLRENEVTTVFIMNTNDNKMVASVNDTKGYGESLSLRSELSRTGRADFFKTIKKSYTDNFEVNNEGIDSLSQLDMPLKVRYELSISNNEEDIIYFNPMLANQQKDNPFTAAQRFYPVEMPFCRDENYILNMDIPAGYEVEELPKSTRVKLNENEGMFEYLIAKNGDKIQLRTRVKLEKAVYEPEDYQTLRDFFTYVVKKEAEQIVFKKKSGESTKAN